MMGYVNLPQTRTHLTFDCSIAWSPLPNTTVAVVEEDNADGDTSVGGAQLNKEATVNDAQLSRESIINVSKEENSTGTGADGIKLRKERTQEQPDSQHPEDVEDETEQEGESQQRAESLQLEKTPGEVQRQTEARRHGDTIERVQKLAGCRHLQQHQGLISVSDSESSLGSSSSEGEDGGDVRQAAEIPQQSQADLASEEQPEFSVPRKAFRALCEELSECFASDIDWEADAIGALQTEAERRLVKFFSGEYIYAVFSKL